MPEYQFSLTHILLLRTESYRFFDSAVIQENTNQSKSLFWHILRSICVAVLVYFKVFIRQEILENTGTH